MESPVGGILSEAGRQNCTLDSGIAGLLNNCRVRFG